DLQAVLAESGAQMVFGVSAGGLAVLEAARTLPGVRMVAVYEPALAMDATRNTAWLERFDRELADGKLAAAMITSMYGLELAPPFFKIMPRRLLASLTEMAMKSEDSKAAPEAITMRKLAPTIHYEGVLIAEMAGTVGAFRTVTADVLILGGSKGLPFLKPARDALARTLPRSRRVEFPGLASEVVLVIARRPRRLSAGSSSPADIADRGEQHQDEGGDGEDAVQEDERHREVPFRGDNSVPGKRRTRVADGPVHTDPPCRHDQAQDGDGAQGGDRGPGQPLLVEQKVADPQHQAAEAEQGVSGNHRHGQASRGRGLELAVVLDDPDNKENEASQN